MLHRFWWPSEATTRRIIAASIPCADHQHLRQQLHGFYSDFLIRASSARGWKIGRDKRAKAIVAAATTLLEAFAEPKDRGLDLHLWWQVDVVPRDDLIVGLRALKEAAENVPGDDNSGGLKAWATIELGRVFEACFGRSEKYTRDCEGVYGAKVSFIQAVAAEIKLDGKPFEISGETIAKALAVPRRDQQQTIPE
jgi:hypothetical protein